MYMMKVGNLSHNKSGCNRSVILWLDRRLTYKRASTAAVLRSALSTARTSARMTVLVQVVVLMCVRGVFDAVAFKARSRYGQNDAFLVARCEAHCWTASNRSSCIKSCVLKPFNKPGRCPKDRSNLTPFEAICLDTCQQDAQCQALTKCCRHNCGVTCQNPEELSSAVGVPGIPQDIRASEGLKKRTVLVEWRSPQINNETTVYLIEQRHHTGHNFMEKHLSDWALCGRSIKTSHVLKEVVKPGRWYQFRVAAVNSHGTKGFSENSPIFNIATRPKPPKPPQNVTATAFKRNGTIFGELRWLSPRSDLPIQGYKIFWSRRLQGVKPLDSVLVHQQVVPKEPTNFILKDLKPNSLYFLQIQALAHYGKKRLKGQKSGLILNTTNYSSAEKFEKNKIEELRLSKIYWLSDLRVRIVWKPKKEFDKYTVILWNETSNALNNFKLAATTEVL